MHKHQPGNDRRCRQGVGLDPKRGLHTPARRRGLGGYFLFGREVGMRSRILSTASLIVCLA
jgi:hypothetical protein